MVVPAGYCLRLSDHYFRVYFCTVGGDTQFHLWWILLAVLILALALAPLRPLSGRSILAVMGWRAQPIALLTTPDYAHWYNL